MQRRALFAQIHFDNFLGVVPRAAGVGHEDGLVQAEDRDRNQIADEEVLVQAGKRERDEEHGQEDIEHAALGVLACKLPTTRLLSSIEALVGAAIELDVRLDEFDGPIGAGHDRLRRSAGEPINHGAAGDQAQQERRMQQRQITLGALRWSGRRSAP